MNLYRTLVLVGFFLPMILDAQEIAIIDQGRNTTMTNRGAFYNPICVGMGDVWYGRTRTNDPYSPVHRSGDI